MNKMSKSTTYSWRLSTELKARLEAAARDEKSDVGAILDRVVGEWLKQRKTGGDTVEQERGRAALMRAAGVYKGDGTPATNTRVRQELGEYLEAKHGRRRAR
jgi:hypothetical protein